MFSGDASSFTVETPLFEKGYMAKFTNEIKRPVYTGLLGLRISGFLQMQCGRNSTVVLQKAYFVFNSSQAFAELDAEHLPQLGNPTVLNHLDVVDLFADDFGCFLQAEVLKKTQDDYMALVFGQFSIHGGNQRLHHNALFNLRVGRCKLSLLIRIYRNLEGSIVLIIA